MSTEPTTNSGAINQANGDFSSGQRADTTNWSDAQRTTYDSTWDALNKKSGN